MCIIVAKDRKHPLPKDEYLKNCFDNNPDGAGFMYVNNGEVVIDKGYMTIKTFMKRYRKLCRKYNNFKDKSLVMHFRIGTAGANSRENTHPYPVTYDKKLIHKTYYRTDLGVAHNGIIHDYNPKTDDKTTNDTQNFIINYIYPLYKNYNKFYKNKYIMEGIEKITGSKFAFLDKYDNIYLVGKFEEDESGVKYSNSNYLPYYNYGYDYYKYYDRYYDMYGKYISDDFYDKSTTKKEDEDFLDETLKTEPEYEIVLESNWYISTDEKDLERVGDRCLVYDFYNGYLYEVNDMGDYEFITDFVSIFDENGEEVLF